MDIVHCLSWEVSPTFARLWILEGEVWGITLKQDLVRVWLEGCVVFLLGVQVEVVEGSFSSGHHIPSQDGDQVSSGMWDPSKSQGQQKSPWVGAG